MTYRDELNNAMLMLAEDPRAVFVGQAVSYPGTAMYGTLEGIDREKRLEFPVAENMQLGFCTGIALAGGLPISIFPRINFLLEATSQLVQHLDKLPLYSGGGYNPRVIIRTAVATPHPLDPGEQHLGDYTDALRLMLKTVHVETLPVASWIVEAYRQALTRTGSTLLVEYTELYNHE